MVVLKIVMNKVKVVVTVEKVAVETTFLLLPSVLPVKFVVPDRAKVQLMEILALKILLNRFLDQSEALPSFCPAVSETRHLTAVVANLDPRSDLSVVNLQGTCSAVHVAPLEEAQDAHL